VGTLCDGSGFISQGGQAHAAPVQITGIRKDQDMNWDKIEGNWKQFKGNVQAHWGKLTDDEVDQAEGNREKLAGKIQERYGLAKDEAERQIDDFLSKH
jgi:uncharacterized protein YjbJ (UPF0337 family)